MIAVGANDLRQKLETNIETLAQEYFLDDMTETIGEDDIDAWKLTLGTMNHLAGGNMMLVGEPGTGKTTFANTIAAVNTGLPLDLYAKTQIQGHPDVTKEDILARPDIGTLLYDGDEDVVFQNTVYMPEVTVDEMNRMPEGKQSIMQEYIRTGIVGHLNKVYSREQDVPFAATVNHPDGGTYNMTPPIRDRFDISLEFTHGHGHYQEIIDDFAQNLEDDLMFPDATEEVLAYLEQKDVSPDEKETFLDEVRDEFDDAFREHGFEPFSDDEREALMAYADEIEFTQNARSFLNFMYDEINLSSDGNAKRRSDEITEQLHDDMLGFTKIENGMSARRYDAVETFAKLTAFYNADDAVELDHVRTVAPYTLAHALDFTNDYASQHEGQARLDGEREEMDLSRRLVTDIKDHYDDHREDIKAINTYSAGGDLTDAEEERIEQIATGHAYDHPYMQQLQQEVQDQYDR